LLQRRQQQLSFFLLSIWKNKMTTTNVAFFINVLQ